jgi:fatty acid desaturase
MEGTPVFCRACGKQIEEGARFCRFCGKSQVEGPGAATRSSPAAGPTLGQRVRQVFPRHHWQDEITHFLTITAMVIGVAGFLIALFPPLGGGIYALAWLLFAILLLLFVMHREATLNHARADRSAEGGGVRYHAARGVPAQTSEARPEK